MGEAQVQQEPVTSDKDGPYVYPKIKQKDTLAFLYKPHTISVLIVGGVLLVYFAFHHDARMGTVNNIKTGLLASSLMFLMFSMVQMRDGLFTRPHPAFWRVVMGLGVLYFMMLVFTLFQSKEDARHLLTYIDPKLGVALPERSYAENCDLYTPNDPTSNFRNLLDTINDEFIWAHLIGWWVKTILLRDAWLCMVLSILFEVWEVTFEHLLPNFKECWWDHIILDVVVCNGLGIYLGLLTCRALKMKEYDWAGMWKMPNPQQKIWYSVLRQFTPFSYDEYNWQLLKDFRHFFYVTLLIVFFSIVELNAFFLKFLLWVPPPHVINIWRLLMWVAIGTPGLREYYQFITDPTYKKFGTMAWLCCAILGLEVLICVKFSPGEFPTPAPPVVVWSWCIFLTFFSLATLIFFTRKNTSAKKHLKHTNTKQHRRNNSRDNTTATSTKQKAK